MKYKVKITSLSHDDIVNLISTACYGSSWLGIFYDSDDYRSIGKDPNDTIEDVCAKLLLNGKSIWFYDMYAEDPSEHYGNLPRRWNADEQSMEYEINLKSLIKGLEKAATKNDSLFECFCDFADENGCNFDLLEADRLMQVVLFGEEIYG